MLREYELMYILRPELDDDGVRAASDGVQAHVENAGGEVTKTTPWGKRRLAYEVQHLRDGHYVLLQLRLEAQRVTDLERALRISDTVFRHLLVVDESVAADEDAVAGAPEAGAAGAEAASPAEEPPADNAEAAPDPEAPSAIAASADEEV